LVSWSPGGGAAWGAKGAVTAGGGRFDTGTVPPAGVGDGAAGTVFTTEGGFWLALVAWPVQHDTAYKRAQTVLSGCFMALLMIVAG